MKTVPITGLIPNSSYSVSIRGKDADGNYTDWSSFSTFTSQIDSDPPSTPEAPTVNLAGPQNIIVNHTLNKSISGKLESDIAYLEVQTSDSSDSYVATTIIGNIPIGPLASAGVSQRFIYPAASASADVFVKARVRAVDRSGNQSSWSAWSTASSNIPAFESAYIGNLTANKITTGTLTAGTAISVGSTTPIVLKSNSTSPYGQIYVGAGNWGNADTQFYVDSSNKFSLGSSFTWDGSALNIGGSATFAGTVNAAGGLFTGFVTFGTATLGKDNFTVSTTTYSGLKINANNYWGVSALAATVLKVGDATNYLEWTGSLLSVRGNILATGGSFQGFLTAGTTMYLGQNITLALQGAIPAGTYSGLVLDAGTGYNFWLRDSSGGIRFQVGNNTNFLRWTGSALEINGSGTFNGSGSFSGNIYASNGTIGGWNIGASAIFTGTLGAGTYLYPSGNTWAFISTNAGVAAKYAFFDSGTTPGGYTLQVSGTAFISTSVYTPTITNSINPVDVTSSLKNSGVPTVSGSNNVILSATNIFQKNSASSQRFKNSIIDIDNIPELNSDLLLNIPIRAFRYNDDYLMDTDSRYQIFVPGMVAEEVDSVYPIAVEYDNDDYSGPPLVWNEKYLIPGMLKLIQKQHAKINYLETRIAALE